MSLTEHKDGSATLSEARHKVLLESTWELTALAELLPTLTSNESPEALRVGYQVRCISSRIKELASIQMAGLGDDAEKTEDLKQRLEVSG